MRSLLSVWICPWVLIFQLSSLTGTDCSKYNITLHSTTRVEKNVRLGDQVIITCAQDRYDNLLYLRTKQQLTDCNVSSTPHDYQSSLPSYIHVGACASPVLPSFKIDIRRTSEFLASSVPFENGGTYHFTSFTDGTAQSTSMKPTSGGDCLNGFSIVLHVIDTDPSLATPTDVPTTVDDPTDLDQPDARGIEASGSNTHIHTATILVSVVLYSLL